MKIFTLSLFVLFLFSGCAAMPKSFEQSLVLAEKIADIAERQGVAYNIKVSWDGKLGGAWIQRAEIDSGVTFEAAFHGNAASGRDPIKHDDNN